MGKAEISGHLEKAAQVLSQKPQKWFQAAQGLTFPLLLLNKYLQSTASVPHSTGYACPAVLRTGLGAGLRVLAVPLRGGPWLPAVLVPWGIDGQWLELQD